MNHTCLYSPAAVPHSVTALWLVLISRPAEGRRLSWPGWHREILRYFARQKTVTHPGTIRGGRESNSGPSSHELSALRPMSHLRFCRASSTRDFDARESRIE